MSKPPSRGKTGGKSSSSSSSSSASLPPSDYDTRCYCSDPTPLQSDLVCSYNSPSCYTTHISCLKDNSGEPFTNFVVGRSCFLCARCVSRKQFKHPPEMVCTLDSQYGCFYEAKGWKDKDSKGKDTPAVATATTGAGSAHLPSSDVAEEKEDDDADSSRASDNGHQPLASPPHPSSPLGLLDFSTAASVPADDDFAEPKAKSKRRGIRDADKKQKGKLVPRCTSPSHFLIDEPGSSATPAPTPNPRILDKLRTDSLLSSVSSLYYRPRIPHINNLDVWVSADYDRTEYPTLDSLLSPLRRPSPLDHWSPYEIALFESGICSYGKDFHAISRLISGAGRGKSSAECVDFYYVWKKSGHYNMWKEFGKPVRKRNEGKAEQHRVVEGKMKGFTGPDGGGSGKRLKVEDDREDVENGVKVEKEREAAPGAGEAVGLLVS